MPFVLDNSITGSWSMEDEEDPIAIAAYKLLRKDSAFVPSVWWYEMRNMLVINERRKRIAEADTEKFLYSLSNLRITIDLAPDENRLLSLARKHRLTVYDAAYLELALRKDLPVATLDKELARAARAEKVELIDK